MAPTEGSTSKPSQRGPARRLFADDELVWTRYPNGPRYGDADWSLRDVPTRVGFGERNINVGAVPSEHFHTVKHLLMTLAEPSRPQVVDNGVIIRGEGAPPGALYRAAGRLTIIARWSANKGLDRFADWQREDADLFLKDLQLGRYREGGRGLGPSTIRQYVESLRLLRTSREALPEGLGFMPWDGRSAAEVAGLKNNNENLTPPLPWETWGPLVAAAWFVVDQLSTDILRAISARRALPLTPGGPSGRAAFRALQEWDAVRGAVPLHTGWGQGARPRGSLNRNLLFRMLGLNASIVRPAHAAFEPEAVDILEAAAADPGRAHLGGLIKPEIRITHPDGAAHPWVGEIGLPEATYFESVLRGACYVLIASLTGMRDSEIQQLARDSSTDKDGLPALRSIQFKGIQDPVGEPRSWWAPRPVMRTVDVLQQLSDHEEHLFARHSTNETAGVYHAFRDIRRLIACTNDEPAARPGRGHGLNLTKIQHVDVHAINATSLRRSFAVYATTHPGAELGMGIQLGHTAWRMTSGYMSDGQEQAVILIDTERQQVLHNDTAALILDASPVAGHAAAKIHAFRGHVIADPERADHIIDQAADRIHLGIANDCMWNPATSGCGPDRPKLGDHVCIGLDCTNAFYREVHLPVIEAAIDRIDTYLARPRLNAQLAGQLRPSRAALAKIRRDLSEAPAVENGDT